jgi:tetratricopeptide (TPR) repeat protein
VSNRISSILLTLLLFGSSVVSRAAEPTSKPLQASELLALVAGDVLPANVAHEINARGLSFHPDDAYRTLLKRAGAEATVLAAMDKAKVTEGSEEKPEIEWLEHISAAKELMAGKHYSEAAQELSTALELSFARPDTGFVMGELLREQEEWSQAAAIYAAVLREAPDFPGAHTKLSYILYRLGDLDRALTEAKAALAQNPDDAEAHKNAALALESAGKFGAAEVEFKKALRLKPDYAAVHYDLGILFYDQKAYDRAIAEYRKAIALNPNEPQAHCNLANAYRDKGDTDSAIREYQEAERLSPNDPINVYNLAIGLMDRSPRQAIPVFQELESKFPDFAMSHEPFADALRWTGDVSGAQREYKEAIQSDPSDPEPHLRLGEIQKDQKNYEAALDEFRTAARLDGASSEAHKDIGEILLAKKDLSGAIAELKRAESLAPADWSIHEIYAQALAASGDADLAISEYKEAILLDPKQFQVMLELGAALERRGDWVGAMAQYRRAALGETAEEASHPPGESHIEVEAEKAYKAAQVRLEEHLAKLKASGKSKEASDLENGILAMNAAPGNGEKLESLLHDGASAFKEHRFDDAENLYQQAVELAHKLPDNKQMAFALDRLANTYGMKGEFPKAIATLHRELDFVQKAYGPGSPQAVQPLMSLGFIAGGLKDYVAAEQYFSRALAIDEAALGENSGQTAECLRTMAGVYMAQQMWAKAEPFLLRAVKAEEQASTGPDDPSVMVPLWGLCDLYDRWEKPAQAEPCYKRTVEIVEKNYGNTSSYLIPSLDREAAALRKLGHPDEAANLEHRSATIKQVTAKQY